MSKFTPGPWTPDIEWPYEASIRADGQHIVAELSVHKGRKEAEANASLIAAAPDLLASLKGLLAEYEFDEANPGRRKAFIAARLAVAKAEGV
jgi:hypothetical protein